MTRTPQTVEDLLRGSGLKATAPRLAVYEAMLSLGHASADDVCAMLKASGDTCTVATVYNVLETFVEKGLLSRRFSSNNKMYFDVNSCRLIHLYDSVNHEFKDIVDESLYEYLDSHFKRRSFRGYKIDSVDVQLVCHPAVK